MNFVQDPSLSLYLPLYQLEDASFMSKDAYGRLCTVTGALWGTNGRYLDGSDDEIDLGSPILSGDFTIDTWASGTADGNDRPIVDQYGVGQTGRFLLRQSANRFQVGLQSTWRSSITPVVTGRPFHIAATRAGGAITLLINGQIENTGSDATTVYQGVNTHLGGPYGRWKGHIHEIRIYQRALTPLEIQYNYLATKWRYQ